MRYAVEHGVEVERTAVFITIFGVMSAVTRLAVGKIVDMFRDINWLPLYILQGSFIVLGLMTFVLAHSCSYTSFITFSFVYGICDGGAMSQQCFLVLKCVGARRLLTAFGFIVQFYSPSIIVGAPIGGRSYKTYN